jgi:ubiquinone/menaquinone biosynthesis C-methylase UbiE
MTLPGDRSILLCLDIVKRSNGECPLLAKGMFDVKNIFSTVAQYMDFLDLPKSIKAFYSVKELRRLVTESGFSQVVVHSMTFGIATVFCRVAKG